MSDIDTLSGIAEWAAYNSHGNIFHSVISMINEFNVEGIETRSNLYQRAKFFSLVERLDHMNYLDRQSFSDVVTLLDELQNTWGDSLLAKGIHQFKWLNRRHEVVVEMGIGVLRSGIGLDGSECPGELSDIHVLSSFDFEQYEQFVTELFESHRKYLEGSRDDKGDIETEHEMITQSITDLCNIMDMPTAPKRGSKRKDKLEPSLSIKKLRILLDKHSLKQTSKFVLDFVKHVQELVLPIPVLHLAYESHQAQALPQNMRSPDWTDEQRRTSGPYASENGGSVQEGLGTRRSHSLSSNAADGSAHSSSNMTSSSHVAKKSKTAQSKVGPTSSSPGKSKQTDNVGSDHPTPGTLTKAVTVFDIKMGKKDPLPDILTQLALPPVPSRIVHRSSNRIAEINSRDGNAKSGNSTTPMASKKKTPISRAVVEDDDHLMSKTEEDEEEEEEELEGTDDDAATEDQDEDADWKPRTSIAIKEERRASASRKSIGSSNEKKSASQQKKQLHELDHYMENSTSSTGVRGPKQGQGQGGARKRPLQDTRPSAERVEFNDSLDDIDDDEDASDSSDFNVKHHMQRLEMRRNADRREHPDRLERAREHVVYNRKRFSKELNPRRKWTHDEVLALEDAVAKYGCGRWAEILEDSDYKQIFDGRTNVNLKDKYRNMSGDANKR